MTLASARRLTRLAATVAAATLGLAACGGSTTASQAPTGPVVMAVVGPLTGIAASLGQSILEGAKTAQKVINDAGGINGRTLQLDTVDTLADPADAVPAMNKEVATGHPVALVGPVTGDIHGVQPIFDRQHIVDGWQGGSPQFDTNSDPWLWRCNPSDSQLGIAMAILAHQKGYVRAVSLLTSNGSGDTLGPVLQNAFQALGGQVAGTVIITPGQTSYRSETQRVLDYHPDVVFLQVNVADGAVLFANMKELNNLTIPIIGSDVQASTDFVKAVGPSVAATHMLSVQGSDALTAAGTSYLNTYKGVNNHPPLSGSEFAYDCVIDFALAMTKAGTSDPNVWVNSITAVSNPPGILVSDYKTAVADIKAGTKIDYAGVSGPLDFNKYHNVAGAWDVVQATGAADDGVLTVETIAADSVQQVIKKEGGV